LDVGCGIGDVSLVAAGIVGDSGQVTAFDIDQQALEVARARASSRNR
jgi:ubiquinone/menaquinone biosynthesis C-methylase UbiE